MEKLVAENDFNHYALVENGVVVDVIVWDGVSDYPESSKLVDLSSFDPEPGIGWDFDGKKFVDNRPVEPFPVAPETV